MADTVWRDRTVLVTGISGFLGAWLAKTLVERGATVFGLDKAAGGALELHQGLAGRVTVIEGDITSLEDVERALKASEADSCFHLAGHSMVDPESRSPLTTFEANTRGTWVVLEAARRFGRLARIMVASSNHVYGHQQATPSSEDAPLNGASPYAASKACTDLIARCFAATYHMPIAIARNTNTYGGADPHHTHIVTSSILSLLQGCPPVIQSDGTPHKSYLYVEDTIAAYLRLGERADAAGVRGEAFNICMDTPVSVHELVDTLIRVSGVSGIAPKIAGEPGRWHEREFLSNRKAKAVLGWAPHYSLEAGLRKTFEWYRQRLGAERRPTEPCAA